MDYSQKLALSYYKTIATLNEAHNIFLVQHRDTNKIFVKKVLTVYNADIYELLSGHPICGIPQIIDYYELDGQLTLIETYISGQSLEELIRTVSLDLSTILQYTLELCAILSKLHNMNPPIVHRDIKPSNIIITEYNHVVLIDFNAAKKYSHSSPSDTVLLGTKGYAAPEQYGFGSSSPKTDIYAVGVLLKELTSSLPDIPLSLNKIITKCIQIDPSERYQTVDDLAAAIREATHMPESKTEPSFSLNSLLFPGFRTRTLWKMVVAAPIYLVIFWLTLSIRIENTYGLPLLIQRIICLLMFLSVIFGTFNYMNIHNWFPFCKSRYPIVRILGIILLDTMLVSTLFILMVLLISVFFS